MDNWQPKPPTRTHMGDHDVSQLSQCLRGKRVALLVTGGIAALKTPMLARSLRKNGAQVVAFLSQEGARYVTEETLAWCTNHPVVTRLTPQAEHLYDSAPFDAYVVAPATYNTINKVAQGIADGTVTATLATALGRLWQGRTQVLFAPTMHGDMHNPILEASVEKLKELGCFFIAPRDDYGKHNLPDDDVIVVALSRALSSSPLKGKSILVTGGPTPVLLDNVRRLTNKFTGRLGTAIAMALYSKGVDVHLIHGASTYVPPSFLPHQTVTDYDQYKEAVTSYLQNNDASAAIFSAAVADYKPIERLPGKVESGKTDWRIALTPTVKVIDEVHEQFPNLCMITFKYQENITHEALMIIAKERLSRGYRLVVMNRGEDKSETGQQVAYLVTPEGAQRFEGKSNIALGIVSWLEAFLS